MKVRFLAALSVLLAVAACGTSRAPQATGVQHAPAARFGMVTVTEADAGQAIVLKPGEQLEVLIASRPAKGYAITLGSSVDPVLSPDGEVQFIDDAQFQLRDGVTNFERWRFRAAAVGQTTLRFDYRRPWERTGPASQSIAYPVVVR